MIGGYGFAGLRRKSVSLLERQVGKGDWCFFFSGGGWGGYGFAGLRRLSVSLLEALASEERERERETYIEE